jgi:hypothetical protein
MIYEILLGVAGLITLAVIGMYAYTVGAMHGYRLGFRHAEEGIPNMFTKKTAKLEHLDEALTDADADAEYWKERYMEIAEEWDQETAMKVIPQQEETNGQEEAPA